MTRFAELRVVWRREENENKFDRKNRMTPPYTRTVARTGEQIDFDVKMELRKRR